MTSEVFINSAIDIDNRVSLYSCQAIFRRMTHGFSNAERRYRLMFDPRPEWYPPGHVHACDNWWNACVGDFNEREARVYALLLADAIYRTRDL